MPTASTPVSYQDRQDCYRFLSRQSPKIIADILLEWDRPLQVGCTENKRRECLVAKNLIWMWLYTVTSCGNARKVIEELAARGAYELLEERVWTRDYWSYN